jgi:hypothetical protein
VCASRENRGLAKPTPAGVGFWRARAWVANSDPRVISTRSGLLVPPVRGFFLPCWARGLPFSSPTKAPQPPLPPSTDLQSAAASCRCSFGALAQSDALVPLQLFLCPELTPESRLFLTPRQVLKSSAFFGFTSPRHLDTSLTSASFGSLPRLLDSSASFGSASPRLLGTCVVNLVSSAACVFRFV